MFFSFIILILYKNISFKKLVLEIFTPIFNYASRLYASFNFIVYIVAIVYIQNHQKHNSIHTIDNEYLIFSLIVTVLFIFSLWWFILIPIQDFIESLNLTRRKIIKGFFSKFTMVGVLMVICCVFIIPKLTIHLTPNIKVFKNGV